MRESRRAMSADDDSDNGKFGQRVLVTALSAGLAGLFLFVATLSGTVIGGWISRDATLDAQRNQFEHEQSADAALAQGLARVMVADFDGAVQNLCDIGTRGSWFVAFVPLRSRVSVGDRRTVATHLGPAKWQVVADADVRLGTWDAAQRAVVNKHVDPVDWGFPLIIDKAVAARQELESLAGYSAGNVNARKACPEAAKWTTNKYGVKSREFTCIEQVPSGPPPPGTCAQQRKRFDRIRSGADAPPLP